MRALRCCGAILSSRPHSPSWRVVFAATGTGGPWRPPATAAAPHQHQPPAPPAPSALRGAAATTSARRAARAARATTTPPGAGGAAATPSAPSSPSSRPAPLPPTLDLCLPPAANAKVRTAVYRGSAVRLGDCPPEDAKRPEVAVIGRSNVGKSSLINALTGSKGLAMVSKSPGKTRTINHFLVNDGWWLVDLPGYGYAKTAKTTREQFDAFSRDYLSRRRTLAMVLLLVDASVPPQRVDLEYAAWLAGEGVPFAVVFTKTDKRPKKKGSGVGGVGAAGAGGRGGGGARASASPSGEGQQEEEQEEEDHGGAAAEDQQGGEEDDQEQQQEQQQHEGAAAKPPPAPPAVPRAALASPHALAFLRALADEQGFRLLPPSMATSAATGAGTAEVLRFVASVRLGFLQQRKAAKEEAQRRAMEAEEEEEEDEDEDEEGGGAGSEKNR